MYKKETVKEKLASHVEKTGIGTKHFLKAICVMPNLKFASQQTKEIPVLLVRRHPIFLIFGILSAFLWLFVGIVFNLAWKITLKGLVSESLLLRLEGFTLLYAVGLTITSMIYSLSKWFYNLFLITNYRVVDLDFRTLNKTSWTEALLDRIEDIEVRNTGFLESLFNLGDIFVQTAGSQDKIEIRRIPKPMKVQNVLLELAQNMKKHEHIS